MEELERIVELEAFRPTLSAALAYSDGSKSGRPPYDPVPILKALILAAQNNVSEARIEYLIRDRLTCHGWSDCRSDVRGGAEAEEH